MISRASIALAALLVTSGVSAQDTPPNPPEPPASACRATFPRRLAAALQTIDGWLKELVDYRDFQASPKGKAVAFFSEHCRFLNALERAVRKLDDPAAFVCDPTAGPKPKALTSKLLLDAGNEAPILHGIGDEENRVCEAEDPVSLLVTSDIDDRANKAKINAIVRQAQSASAVTRRQ